MKCFAFAPLRRSRRISPRRGISLASPSDDGNNHRTTPHSSADFQPLYHSKSPWQPKLSIIREDHVGVAEDYYYNNVDPKPYNKSSSAILLPDDYFTNREKSKLVLTVALFSFSIF